MYREPGQRDDSETYYSYAKRTRGVYVWLALVPFAAALIALVFGMWARDLTYLLGGAIGILVSIALITIAGMRAKKGDFETTRIEPGPVRVEIPAEEPESGVEASDRKRSAR